MSSLRIMVDTFKYVLRCEPPVRIHEERGVLEKAGIPNAFIHEMMFSSLTEHLLTVDYLVQEIIPTDWYRKAQVAHAHHLLDNAQERSYLTGSIQRIAQVATASG